MTAQRITLKINGQEVGAVAGRSILEVAREHGIAIPTLCFLEGLSVAGACRLCVVELAGVGKLLSACATLAEDGMEVTTDSERLARYRRTIVELLFSEGNHVCSVCVSNGHCELQDLAGSLGVTHIGVPYLNPHRSVDASHPRFALDHNRCILCTRCVRVCDEVEGAHVWDVAGRGVGAHIVSDLNQPWGESQSCTSCGKCVQVCPTGALIEKGKSVTEMTKHREFLPILLRTREAHE